MGRGQDHGPVHRRAQAEAGAAADTLRDAAVVRGGQVLEGAFVRGILLLLLVVVAVAVVVAVLSLLYFLRKDHRRHAFAK